jgi:hypothetical protein
MDAAAVARSQLRQALAEAAADYSDASESDDDEEEDDDDDDEEEDEEDEEEEEEEEEALGAPETDENTAPVMVPNSFPLSVIQALLECHNGVAGPNVDVRALLAQSSLSAASLPQLADSAQLTTLQLQLQAISSLQPYVGPIDLALDKRLDKSLPYDVQAISKAAPGPKKALTAYMYFVKKNRAKVAAANEAMKPTEVIRILGEQWRAIGPADKAVSALARRSGEAEGEQREQQREQ